jgi:hypothetical protein
MAIDRMNGPAGPSSPSFGSDAGRGEVSLDDATRFKQLLEQQRGPDAGASATERDTVARNLGRLSDNPEAEAAVKRTLDTEMMAKIKEGFVKDIVRDNGNEMQRMEREMAKHRR